MRKGILIAVVTVAVAGCGATAPVPATTTSASTAAHIRSTTSGNGTKNLGTVTIQRPAIIEWSCTGCAAFGLASQPSGSNVIAISSTANSGTSDIAPGSYPDAQVIANGDWTIRIVPQ